MGHLGRKGVFRITSLSSPPRSGKQVPRAGKERLRSKGFQCRHSGALRLWGLRADSFKFKLMHDTRCFPEGYLFETLHVPGTLNWDHCQEPRRNPSTATPAGLRQWQANCCENDDGRVATLQAPGIEETDNLEALRVAIGF